MPLRPLLLPALALSFVLACAFLPAVGSAEKVDVRAAGATLGAGKGVAGIQWDDDAAVGFRYWRNDTASMEIILTLCIVTDSHTMDSCERHHLSP